MAVRNSCQNFLKSIAMSTQAEESILLKTASYMVSQVRHPIPSHPVLPPPPYGQDWNGYISASNPNRALMFDSYERSFRILQFGCYGNISLATVNARSNNSRTSYFKHVIRVEIGFWVSIASLIDCQKQTKWGRRTRSCLKHCFSCCPAVFVQICTGRELYGTAHQAWCDFVTLSNDRRIVYHIHPQDNCKSDYLHCRVQRVR